MPVHITESIWLNTTSFCSFQQLVEVSGLSSEELRELIDIGAIVPAQQEQKDTRPAASAGEDVFRMECIVVARKARRLRDDLELDMAGLALALRLLQRIDDLEDELHSVSARLMQQSGE